jgi:hypothetical protein
MKKRGAARRGANLAAVRLAKLTHRATVTLLEFGAPGSRQPPIITADAIAELDEWIAECDWLIADAESSAIAGQGLTRAHIRAIERAQVLREFRQFLIGEGEAK